LAKLETQTCSVGSALITQITISKPVVLVSWNGHDVPLACIHHDAKAQFEWVLFDYSGKHPAGAFTGADWQAELLAQPTECKGEIYSALAEHLHAQQRMPEYVALLDDDIWISVSDINRALHLARCERLDVFSPVLTHDSYYSHRWSLQQPHRLFRAIDWVEVMMPFYRGEIFLAGREHYRGNVSSWGIDKFLMPTLQQLSKRTRTALIDAVAASHRRPVTSGNKTYRNGLTAKQEHDAMRARCVELLHNNAHQLLASAWYQRVFVQRHARSRWQRLLFGLGRPLRRWLEQST
jgi:hypothetical protein